MANDKECLPLMVKVGGSLFDLQDLGARLRRWLEKQNGHPVIFVPGGGAVAEAIRQLDRCHRLGEGTAHWLALFALRLNARFLASLLGGVPVLDNLRNATAQRSAAPRSVLDPYCFALADEGLPGCLPHSWSVTSDSIAARAASVTGAKELILLKSIDIPEEANWETAAQKGLVDAYFPQALGGLSRVRSINFRRWS